MTESLTMESHPKDPNGARDKNVLVIGGPGSGKTRFFVKPNLKQMHSSYVVTDPKGTILTECGTMLKRNEYQIRVPNTINFKRIMHYNPFADTHSEKDILKLVNAVIIYTKGEGEKAGENFWFKAGRLYYSALIGYIWHEVPERDQNFTTLLEMIDASEAREDDESFKNPVDELCNELEEKTPDHFALRQYKKCKLAAGKIVKSILISCGARLAPFDIYEFRKLMSYDEMDLDLLGDRLSADPISHILSAPSPNGCSISIIPISGAGWIRQPSLWILRMRTLQFQCLSSPIYSAPRKAENR